jgi:hypothetical protein
MEHTPHLRVLCGVMKIGRGVRWRAGLTTRSRRVVVCVDVQDSNYLYWCDNVDRMGAAFVTVLRGRLPATPTGLYQGGRGVLARATLTTGSDVEGP